MGNRSRNPRAVRRTTFTVCVVTLLLAALTFGATSRQSSSSDTQGVTKDSIKVGIPLVDFDAIKDFVDYEFGDTEAISKVFVDYINKNGGIDGRQIDAVYKKYPPIPGGKPDPLSLCTAFTEDDKVFAVIGVFIDFTGQGQECVSKQHNTIHIGHEIDQPWIDASPDGLMLTPDRTKEHVAAALISLMSSTGKLKGKTVAVVGDKNNESRVNDVIVPALKKAKAKTGSTAILNITGTDTTAAQAQVDSFIEKWKTEGVNMVFLAGNLVSAKQFAESIKAGSAEGHARHRHRHRTRPGQGRAGLRRQAEPVRGHDQWHRTHAVGALGEQEPDPAAVRRHLREGDRRDGARSRRAQRHRRREVRSTPTRRSPTRAAT